DLQRRGIVRPPPDAIVLASVLQHLGSASPGPKCFVTSNSRDFASPEIEEMLLSHQCKLLFWGREPAAPGFLRHPGIIEPSPPKAMAVATEEPSSPSQTNLQATRCLTQIGREGAAEALAGSSAAACGLGRPQVTGKT